ncbi:restriction endonuclease subunit S [Halobacterium sp. BOL4-2]|uniref:restriction endonuclease subunit S n=1 Tax=Halobacterium sp. BOL4-2 TaxID=2810537 RepID=UPI001E336BE9|nr:restriction endonuclease subunit S [Halobacterium sp. BOL4-2]UDF60537.1 restriction endonuclease subunit S [Halobacterium sp. BOL4-2]
MVDIEIPTHWSWRSLSELGEWKGGSTPKKSNPSYWEGGTIPWVSPKDMKKSTIEKTEDQITEQALNETNSNPLPKGSVLVVTRSGILEHSLPAAITEVEASINQDIKGIVPSDDILPEFILAFLEAFEGEILRDCSKDGTTVASINSDSLYQYKIPVPPLDEQRSIINRIDELSSKIEVGKNELITSKSQIDMYRHASRRAAVSGKMTGNWRSRVGDSPKQRNRQIDSEVSISEFADKHDLESFEIPDGWIWVRFGNLLESSRNGFSKRSGETGTPTHVLRLSDLDDSQEIDPSDPRDIKMTGKERNKFLLQKGDLLCVRVNGSDEIVGRMTVFDEQEDWAFCDHFIRFTLNEELTSPEYISEYFDTQIVRKYVSLNKTSSAGQNTVSQRTMKDIPVPLPPKKEQLEIISELDRTTTILDATETALSENLERANKLRQSVLRQGMKGSLSQNSTTNEQEETTKQVTLNDV